MGYLHEGLSATECKIVEQLFNSGMTSLHCLLLKKRRLFYGFLKKEINVLNAFMHCYWRRENRVRKLWACLFFKSLSCLHAMPRKAHNLLVNQKTSDLQPSLIQIDLQLLKFSYFQELKIILLVFWLQGLFRWLWPLAHSAGVLVFQHTLSLSWTHSITMAKFTRKAFFFFFLVDHKCHIRRV